MVHRHRNRQTRHKLLVRPCACLLAVCCAFGLFTAGCSCSQDTTESVSAAGGTEAGGGAATVGGNGSSTGGATNVGGSSAGGSSAGGNAGPPERTRNDIYRDRIKLPKLFLTFPSHKRIIAPSNKGVFDDPASGEKAWPAIQCQRPECPGRGPAGEPYLFTEGDIEATKTNVFGCTMCLAERQPDQETQEERNQYISWVEEYVLPETARQTAELQAEAEQLSRQKRTQPATRP